MTQPRSGLSCLSAAFFPTLERRELLWAASHCPRRSRFVGLCNQLVECGDRVVFAIVAVLSKRYLRLKLINAGLTRELSSGLTHDSFWIQRLEELYALNGQVGFISNMRVDSNLLDAGTHPINVLQQHS